MYTQCSHCKAIFRVSMKELTAAQGLLRCGECGSTFDAMKSLSTTLPDDRKFIAENDADDVSPTPAEPQVRKKIYISQIKQADNQQHRAAGTTPVKRKLPKQRKSHSSKFILIAILCMGILLLVQLLYTQKDWLADQPLTASLTRAFCKIANCGVKIRRDLESIEMLNRNVYSHPNESDALMITATIENRAEFEQPYPLLEISFIGQKGDIIALRRFKPEEYLSTEISPQALMAIGKTVDFRVKITDPGQEAVRFQFRFL
ncbi:MAG TPA: DUF3426 domain-containing protein [Thiothrix sp.]|nr:DUF3426 domain-containing protein [Thiothrix sp.]